MGADNWTNCPKCYGKWQGRRESLQDSVKTAKLSDSLSQYTAAVEKLREHEASPLDPAFREDYEIGMTMRGFEVLYAGSCTDCKYEYRFKHPN